MDHMKLFRHKATGKVDYFPDHFEEYPYMELVEPETETCEDCVVADDDGSEQPIFLELSNDEDEDVDNG